MSARDTESFRIMGMNGPQHYTLSVTVNWMYLMVRNHACFEQYWYVRMANSIILYAGG